MGDRSRKIGLAAILVVGVLVRLYVARGLDGKSWNDAAIIGLMAMHALQGKFYAFYWGQSYMGSIESLSIAPFFALLVLAISRSIFARLQAEHFTPKVRVGWTFGHDLTLLGYDWKDLGQRRFEITYYWRGEEKMRDNCAVSVHSKGPNGQFQDDYVLGAPAHLTETWRPGQIVKAVRQVTIPEEVPDGIYSLAISTWDPASKRHLRSVLGGIPCKQPTFSASRCHGTL